jgi:hypothetical protein
MAIDWQPYATAPRDGTCVELRSTGPQTKNEPVYEFGFGAPEQGPRTWWLCDPIAGWWTFEDHIVVSAWRVAPPHACDCAGAPVS